MSDELTAIFTGESTTECDDFILAVRKHARAHGKARDNAWIAEELFTAFSGKALRWFVKQPPEVQGDWSLLERALVDRWADDDDGNYIRRRSGENPPLASLPTQGFIPTRAVVASNDSTSELSGKTGRLKVRTGVLHASDKFLSHSTAEDPWRKGSFLLTSNPKAAMRVRLMPSEYGLWHLEMLLHPGGRKFVAGYFWKQWSGDWGFLIGVDTLSGICIRGQATTYSGTNDGNVFRTAVWKLEDERYLSFVWPASESDGEKKRVPITRRQQNDLFFEPNYTVNGSDMQVELEFELLKA